MKTHVLLVCNNNNYIESFISHTNKNWDIQVIKSKKDFEKTYFPTFDIFIIQLDLNKNDGYSILAQLFEESPTTPIIGLVRNKTKIRDIQIPLNNIVSIQEDINKLIKNIKDILKKEKNIQSIHTHKDTTIIGESPLLKKALHDAYIVAQDGQTNVLITGETGTGKDLLVQIIHSSGIRKNNPFIPVAIPTLNKDTVVSELFGHERGAFTGAYNIHKGYIEQANNGILFLDEIGDLSLDAQIKLLRFLDSKKFRRMGGTRDIKVDIQIIAATNKNFEELIENNLFREDLYYRLCTYRIFMPSLKERIHDIPLLTNHFLLNLYKEGRTTANRFSDTAMELLMGYSWKGNIRELKQVVEFCALRANQEKSVKIVKGFLPKNIIENSSIFPQEKKELQDNDKSDNSIDTKFNENNNIYYILANEELKHIKKALEQCFWKKTHASSILGYNNRFVMRRRVLKHFNTFPKLIEQYPDLFDFFKK